MQLFCRSLKACLISHSSYKGSSYKCSCSANCWDMGLKGLFTCFKPSSESDLTSEKHSRPSTTDCDEIVASVEACHKQSMSAAVRRFLEGDLSGIDEKKARCVPNCSSCLHKWWGEQNCEMFMAALSAHGCDFNECGPRWSKVNQSHNHDSKCLWISKFVHDHEIGSPWLKIWQNLRLVSWHYWIIMQHSYHMISSCDV